MEHTYRELVNELKDNYLERLRHLRQIDTLLNERIAWLEEKTRLINENVRLIEEIIVLRDNTCCSKCTVT